MAGAGLFAGGLFVAPDAWAGAVPPLDIEPGTVVDRNGRPIQPTGGEPYVSGMALVAFNFAPVGWALCDGQILSINQNQSLYSLLGTTYGGDGQTSFALPDLRGRVPLGEGPDSGLGQAGGSETITLPAHTHDVAEVEVRGTGTQIDGVTTGSSQGTASTAATGSGGSASNMQPYLAINVVISLQGIFPSPN